MKTIKNNMMDDPSNNFSIPKFITDKRIQVAVATTGYCQARCELCAWPYMENNKKIMTINEFSKVLDRFSGYSFDEFAFNIINEPLVDKTIADKIKIFIDRKLETNSLFFSSNWLLANTDRIFEFSSVFAEAARSPHINYLSINATVSGIDEETYDQLQAGSRLHETVAPYKKLDFSRAVSVVCKLIAAMEENGTFNERVIFNIKAYGDLFQQSDMQQFWDDKLNEAKIGGGVRNRNIKILLNHAMTTFAQEPRADLSTPVRGQCSRDWLNSRLAIGPNGNVGLCCEDSLRRVQIGNLLNKSCDELVREPSFQEQLSIVTAYQVMPQKHPCQHCQFFQV